MVYLGKFIRLIYDNIFRSVMVNIIWIIMMNIGKLNLSVVIKVLFINVMEIEYVSYIIVVIVFRKFDFVRYFFK